MKGFKVHFRRANPTTTSTTTTTTTTTRRTTTLASSNSNDQIPSSDGDLEQAGEPSSDDNNQTQNDENVTVQCEISGNFYEIGTILSPVCPMGYESSGNIKEVAIPLLEFLI